MAPSWPGLVPAHLHDGSLYPAMTAWALPPELAPDATRAPSLEAQRVENMVQDLLPLGVLPLNLAPSVAHALIFGIQSVFSIQNRARL